ncbi:hypothetical protein [Longimycelium tulufanense]|nr:hypothetical protein [Longimycelium tulufanense]
MTLLSRQRRRIVHYPMDVLSNLGFLQRAKGKRTIVDHKNDGDLPVSPR